MKRVMQTTFGDVGNCFSACIASILECPIEEVPNFCAGNRSRWMLDAQAWLRGRGWAMVSMTFKDFDAIGQAVWIGAFPGECIYIASGKSSRGLLHSVIMCGDHLLHDPHPDGNGVTFGKDIAVEVIFPANKLNQVKEL